MLIVNHASNGLESCLYTWLCCKFCLHNAQGTCIELGNIMILSFIVILKCHDNRNRREIFNIVISPTRYYRKYHDYWKIHCSETFISVKYFQLIFTILVPVVLLSDIVIISIIVIITLMIYRDMKFLLLPIPRLVAIPFLCRCLYRLARDYNVRACSESLVVSIA